MRHARTRHEQIAAIHIRCERNAPLPAWNLFIEQNKDQTRSASSPNVSMDTQCHVVQATVVDCPFTFPSPAFRPAWARTGGAHALLVAVSAIVCKMVALQAPSCPARPFCQYVVVLWNQNQIPELGDLDCFASACHLLLRHPGLPVHPRSWMLRAGPRHVHSERGLKTCP